MVALERNQKTTPPILGYSTQFPAMPDKIGFTPVAITGSKVCPYTPREGVCPSFYFVFWVRGRSDSF